MYALIRSILFLFDAERVHNFTMWFLSRAKFLYPIFRLIYNPGINDLTFLSGLRFRNRLGLAAGLDKNGVSIRFWDAIGFSHIEVGTVTPLPQPGNDKPRIFRLRKDKALINRLGFNNKGATVIRQNVLKARRKISKDFLIGVNIGKNKITPLDKAREDYIKCMEIMYDCADYFTVNISSPNTEQLRELQKGEHLDELLTKLEKLNESLATEQNIKAKPIFLKIAPDLENEGIDTIYSMVKKSNLAGIIATNTTISREGLSTSVNEAGGLSGKPIKEKSDKVLKHLNELKLKNENGNMVLIGVGGVFGKDDYEDKLRNGASLIQVYTGFIYEGPGLIKKILK